MTASPSQHGIFRHSLLLMAATQASNAANVLFQFVMMRALGAEYGALATVLSLAIFLSMPLAALNNTVAHGAAQCLAAGRPEACRQLIARWGVRLAWPALILLCIAFLARQPLAEFYHLGDPRLIALGGAMLALSLFLPVLGGILQGAQYFVWLACLGQVGAVTRLLLSAALVWWVAPRALWALTAQTAGVVLTMLVAVAALWPMLRARPAAKDTPPAPEDLRYFLHSLIVLCGFGALMNLDISLVQHYFPGEQAGLYARASTIARALVFLPTPVSMALFPKVVSLGSTSAYHRHLLFKALALVVGIVLLSGLAGVFLAAPAWRLFTGAWPPAEALVLTRVLFLAMCPLGLTYTLLHFETAQNRFRWPYGAAACAPLFVLLVVWRHTALMHVAGALGLTSLLSVILLAIGLPWRRMPPPPAPVPARVLS